MTSNQKSISFDNVTRSIADQSSMRASRILSLENSEIQSIASSKSSSMMGKNATSRSRKSKKNTKKKYISIVSLYDLITNNQADFEFYKSQIKLPHYDITIYERQFRNQVFQYFISELTNYHTAEFINREDIQFQTNQRTFLCAKEYYHYKKLSNLKKQSIQQSYASQEKISYDDQTISAAIDKYQQKFRRAKISNSYSSQTIFHQPFNYKTFSKKQCDKLLLALNYNYRLMRFYYGHMFTSYKKLVQRVDYVQRQQLQDFQSKLLTGQLKIGDVQVEYNQTLHSTLKVSSEHNLKITIGIQEFQQKTFRLRAQMKQIQKDIIFVMKLIDIYFGKDNSQYEKTQIYIQLKHFDPYCLAKLMFLILRYSKKLITQVQTQALPLQIKNQSLQFLFSQDQLAQVVKFCAQELIQEKTIPETTNESRFYGLSSIRNYSELTRKQSQNYQFRQKKEQLSFNRKTQNLFGQVPFSENQTEFQEFQSIRASSSFTERESQANQSSFRENENQVDEFLSTLEPKDFRLIDEFSQAYCHKDQTAKILNKIISHIAQQISTAKIPLSELNPSELFPSIQQFIYSMVLFNYTMVCRQVDRWKFYPIEFYCGLFLKGQELEGSYTDRKINLMWKSFWNPAIVKRMYLDVTHSEKQLAYLQQLKHFSLADIYQFNVNKGQIEEKAKYYIHLAQFSHEIVSQLTNSQNLSLNLVYNSVRFLLLNLMCHFILEMVKKVSIEIRDKHGGLYFSTLEEALATNSKWIDCLVKNYKGIELSTQKIKAYQMQVAKYKNQEQMPTNAKKILKLFANQQLKNLYKELNSKDNVVVNRFDFFDYSFQRVTKIYSQIVTLLFKQVSNKTVIERIFKKLVKTHKQQKLPESLNEVLQRTKQKQQKQQKYLKVDEQEPIQKKHLKCFFRDLTIAFSEIMKILCLILSLPYYSYQNQRQYMADKKYSDNKKINILAVLDRFYIHDRSRYNTEYLRKKFEQYDVDMFLTVRNYFQNVELFYQFLKLNHDEKQYTLKSRVTKYPIQKIVNLKNIHEDRLSVFDLEQCDNYFSHIFPFNIENRKLEEKTEPKKSQNSIKGTYIHKKGIQKLQKLNKDVVDFFQLYKKIFQFIKNYLQDLTRHSFSDSLPSGAFRKEKVQAFQKQKNQLKKDSWKIINKHQENHQTKEKVQLLSDSRQLQKKNSGLT